MKEVKLSGLSKSQLLRARDEVTVLRRLNHPYLIAYREAFLEEVLATLFIVMEYADGGDLESLIKARAGAPFAEAEVLRLLSQSVDALSYCHHTLKLLHRDIKPANIFLTHSFDVKLGDFGISRSLATSKAIAMTKCGSPLYMAPEICKGLPYGRAADAWSLGCTFYQVMALKEPWMDQSSGGMMGLIRVICNSPIDLEAVRARYSSSLCDLIDSLLCKDPKERPAMQAVQALPWMLAVDAGRLSEITVPDKSAYDSTLSGSSAWSMEGGDSSPIRTEIILAMGTESHAAASVLQSAFHRRHHGTGGGGRGGPLPSGESLSLKLSRCLRGCLRECCYQPPSEASLYTSFGGSMVSSSVRRTTGSSSDWGFGRSDVDAGSFSPTR